MTKNLFLPVLPNEPPAEILKAWHKKEMQVGRALNQNDLATIAAFVMTEYMLTIEPPTAENRSAYLSMVKAMRHENQF